MTTTLHRWIAGAIGAGLMILVATVLFPHLQRSRELARRNQSRNNLKQIGLALHNYHDIYNMFPIGGTADADGRLHHSWTVRIMPYMYSTPVYQYIDFNTPWDSTWNAGLLLNFDAGYESPSEEQTRGDWEFRVTHYSANAHVMGVNRAADLRAIQNRSQVFLVGELGGDFVPWAAPYNFRKLDKLNSDPLTYGRSTRDGCQFVSVDGSVNLVSNSVDQAILKQTSGDDLTGFADHSSKVQRPAKFPCPADTLKWTWKYREFADGTALFKTNHAGELIELSPGDKGAWRATDGELQKISKRTTLQGLEASGNFTDHGLRALQNLKKLRSLSIYSDAVTEAAITELVDELPDLEFVSLRSQILQPTTIARYKEKRPQLKINIR